MSRNYRYIVASNGYVESSQLGCTIWSRQGAPFTDPIKAFRSLASDLLTLYLSGLSWGISWSDIPKCHMYKNPFGTEFRCPTCNEVMRPEFDDMQDFADFLCKLPCMTADDMGDDMEDWYPWTDPAEVLSEPDMTIIIPEYFDSMVLALAKSEAMTEEEQKFLQSCQQDIIRDVKVLNHKGFVELGW